MSNTIYIARTPRSRGKLNSGVINKLLLNTMSWWGVPISLVVISIAELVSVMAQTASDDDDFPPGPPVDHWTEWSAFFCFGALIWLLCLLAFRLFIRTGVLAYSTRYSVRGANWESVNRNFGDAWLVVRQLHQHCDRFSSQRKILRRCARLIAKVQRDHAKVGVALLPLLSIEDSSVQESEALYMKLCGQWAARLRACVDLRKALHTYVIQSLGLSDNDMHMTILTREIENIVSRVEGHKEVEALEEPKAQVIELLANG